MKIDFSYIKEKFFENFFYEEYKEDAGNPEYDRDNKTLEWNFVLKPDEKGKEINVLYGKRSKDNLIKIAYLAFGAIVVEGIRLIFAYLTPD
ncbi:hypothetical protein KKA03_00055 [archaeon]|nr:hypothetical protein [archaeon]